MNERPVGDHPVPGHPELTSTSAGTVLTLHVQPGAKRPGFAGRHGDALRLRVAAPPSDGRANDEVMTVLAATFGVPRSSVRLAGGASSRRKRFVLLDLPVGDAAAVVDRVLGEADQRQRS